MLERSPSGIEGLDSLVEGGFPKKNLILVAGNPGTGKTIFSAHFLYRGAVDYGEKGIYVSFVEDKESFIRYMHRFNMDFEALEREGKVKILSMLTMKERAVSALLETIIDTIGSLKAKRLVIDSFSALAQAIGKEIDVRVFTDVVLRNIVRNMGCTTLIITEVPYGADRLGMGIEEFMADAVIVLRRSRLDERLIRELEILKMRGTSLLEQWAIFTLKDEFKVFPPFKVKPVEKPRRFKPRSDTPEFFSTGSPDLDRMLGGGYPRGSPVLLEIDEHVSTLQYHLILNPTPWNFMSQGRAVMVIPSTGVDPNITVQRAKEGGFSEEELNRLLKICVKEYPRIERKPCIAPFRGKELKEDYESYLKLERSLMEKTGQPVLRITGVDTLIDYYGKGESLAILKMDATKIREAKGLGIVLLKPGYPSISKILGSVAEVHLKVTREHGSLLVYGIKPRTGLHIVEMDTSNGYPMPKLTPII